MSDQSDNNGLLNFIVTTLEDMREQMVTKSDLEQMATKSDLEQMATKSDLEQMATKNDLVYLETRLVNKLEAEITAVRGDIEQVNLRLDSIERTLSARLSQIEAEVSRLRSVVYLLVKDKPEMLRLLGQPPS
jgi:negative regulator of genetic competence, sporulation and motility